MYWPGTETGLHREGRRIRYRDRCRSRRRTAEEQEDCKLDREFECGEGEEQSFLFPEAVWGEFGE